MARLTFSQPTSFGTPEVIREGKVTRRERRLFEVRGKNSKGISVVQQFEGDFRYSRRGEVEGVITGIAFFRGERKAWTLTEIDLSFDDYRVLVNSGSNARQSFLVSLLSGDDSISGSDGDDSIESFNGADTIRGGGGDDTLEGGMGEDLLEGGDGDDLLIGGASPDLLQGDRGSDRLEGDEGDDTLFGGAGDDTLIGGAGDDDLIGGDGDDLLQTGEGLDSLDGGDGSDTLAFPSGIWITGSFSRSASSIETVNGRRVSQGDDPIQDVRGNHSGNCGR